MKKRILILCTFLLVAVVIYTISTSSKASQSSSVSSYEHYFTEPELSEPNTEYDSNTNTISGSSLSMNPKPIPQTVDRDTNSITILVNKDYTLNQTYEPEDLTIPNIKFSFSNVDPKMKLRQEAATAMEHLFNAALEENLILAGVSGYRSYDRQFDIYATNLIRRGVSYTNQYSAMAGSSEHQTGLAMDISTGSIQYKLDDSFADTPEGIWIAKHCYEYGYIIRYPEDKTHVTGYAYEPWHIRYVGVKLATYLTENNLTLDEYYGYQYNDQIYANINYDAIIQQYYYKVKLNSANSTTSKPTDEDIAAEELPDEDMNDEQSNDGPASEDTNHEEPDIPSDSQPDSAPTPEATTPPASNEEDMNKGETLTPSERPAEPPVDTPMVTPTDTPSVSPVDIPSISLPDTPKEVVNVDSTISNLTPSSSEEE